MLKFSGFADLTSCLEREAAASGSSSGKLHNNKRPERNDDESLFKLLEGEVPMN